MLFEIKVIHQETTCIALTLLRSGLEFLKSNIFGLIILVSLLHSPLVHKDELAIDGMARDVLCGFDADVSVHWLRDDVGV